MAVPRVLCGLGCDAVLTIIMLHEKSILSTLAVTGLVSSNHILFARPFIHTAYRRVHLCSSMRLTL